MGFIFRGAIESDLNAIFDLAQQFSLLNLPPDKKIIAEKIARSEQSFANKVCKEDASYLFVTEDNNTKNIAGSSQIKTKHGTETNPTYSFKLVKKERFSKDLGVGFIHQILRLNITTNGPTEIGGLVVAKNYRSRPEKIGRQTSLNRFLYIGMNCDRFQEDLHSELSPPLTDEGRSEFWEALGRRFTGMPYQEADIISRQNKEFIRSLFPEADIYLCLLDSQARLVIGRVGVQSMPALHMLEKIGFKYKEEIDPFDGGPHVGVKTNEVSIIKQAKWKIFRESEKMNFLDEGVFAIQRNNKFLSCTSTFHMEGEEIFLPKHAIKLLNLESGEKVYCSFS